MGPSCLRREIERYRTLGRVEELEQRTLALRQEGWCAAHRIALRWLDLEHGGAEVRSDLARERGREPQTQRHVAVVHLEDGEAAQRQDVGVAHGPIFAIPC